MSSYAVSMKAYKSAVFKLHNPSQRKRAMLHGPTFVSFDIDGLEMAYVRGTQSPEPGELTVKDAMAILRGFSGLDIIGGDVVELLPPKDPPGHTAIVTLNLAFEILCLIAESRARK
jgi:guanidinopropionase